MSGQSGPSGTGLIPPGAEPPNNNGGDPPSPPEPPEPEGGHEPPAAPDPVVQPADIDGPPPVPNSEQDNGGGDGDDEDDVIDPDEFRQEILDEVQRRFDKSISKVVRRLSSGQQNPPSPPGGGDPDGGGAPPPAPVGRQVDTMSIRSYARGQLNDEMENAGRTEKVAVREILDTVLQNTDWNAVEDEEEYVEQLVKKLAGTTQSLIKVGSDRKVAQLRSSGLLPALQSQPGSSAPPTHSAQTGMAKGAAVAQKRWPGGRRRMTG